MNAVLRIFLKRIIEINIFDNPQAKKKKFKGFIVLLKIMARKDENMIEKKINSLPIKVRFKPLIMLEKYFAKEIKIPVNEIRIAKFIIALYFNPYTKGVNS